MLGGGKEGERGERGEGVCRRWVYVCRKSGGGTAGGCLYVEERGCIILWGRVVERGCIFRKNEGWEENVGVCVGVGRGV